MATVYERNPTFVKSFGGCSLMLVLGKCFRLYEVCVSQAVIVTGMGCDISYEICMCMCVFLGHSDGPEVFSYRRHPLL